MGWEGSVALFHPHSIKKSPEGKKKTNKNPRKPNQSNHYQTPKKTPRKRLNIWFSFQFCDCKAHPFTLRCQGGWQHHLCWGLGTAQELSQSPRGAELPQEPWVPSCPGNATQEWGQMAWAGVWGSDPVALRGPQGLEGHSRAIPGVPGEPGIPGMSRRAQCQPLPAAPPVIIAICFPRNSCKA